MIRYEPVISVAKNDKGQVVCPFCGQYLSDIPMQDWTLHNLGGWSQIRICGGNCKQRPKPTKKQQMIISEVI